MSDEDPIWACRTNPSGPDGCWYLASERYVRGAGPVRWWWLLFDERATQAARLTLGQAEEVCKTTFGSTIVLHPGFLGRVPT